MNWFLIALIGPILASICNHIDKYLISKYFKGGGVGSLMIFSSLFAVVVLPAAFFFEPHVLNISPTHAIVLIFNSMLWFLGLTCYLYALQKGEASMVVPIFQTIPVFGYFLAFLILGETLTLKQILASLLIIAGAVTLSIDLNEGKIKLKAFILLLMLIASFLGALSGVIFKLVALESNFWISTFWSQVGTVLIGVFILIFIKSYRIEFLRVISTNKLFVLGLNGINEILALIAGLAVSYAFLLAPITLVWVVNGFQPFFVFFFGLILTIFFPHLGSESLVKKHLIQKIAAIIIIFIGAYFLHT